MKTIKKSLKKKIQQLHCLKCQDIITHLKKCHVPHAKDPGKDNIVMILEKETTPEEDEFYEYRYYIARIQRRFISTKDQKNNGLKHDTPIIDLYGGTGQREWYPCIQ